MVLRFRAYSRSNRDIEEVLAANKRLIWCQINEPIIVFGDTIHASELKLDKDIWENI